MSTIVSEIRWAVSPDHCDPYRRLSGPRGSEPPPPIPEPPEPPNVDPHFFDVVLLVGSESGHNIDESTYHYGDGDNGGPWVSSTNAKFGTHSINTLDASSFVSYDGALGDHNFDLASTQMMEFTIEAWVYQAVRDPTFPEVICGKSFLGISWAFLIEPNGTPRFAYQTLESGFGGNGKFTNIVATLPYVLTVPLNQWTYVAVTKDAAKHFRLYVGDSATNTVKMVGKRTPNDASIDNTGVLESVDIGQIGFFGTNNWDGQIDELRITKNVARYRTDTTFPLPKRAWPRPPPTAIVRSWENAESL